MNYWLMKSEPTEYSIDDLAHDTHSPWFGVRNYLARNYMRDGMKLGDQILFYHSSCKVPGVAGIAEVVHPAHQDESQFIEDSKYYDPKSTREKPIWYCVDVGFVERFDDIVSISTLREHPGLQNMVILQKGNRLSITPVTEDEYKIILEIGRPSQG